MKEEKNEIIVQIVEEKFDHFIYKFYLWKKNDEMR